MKISEFHRIIRENYTQDILNNGYSTNPQILNVVCVFFFIHNTQGKDIDRLREFAHKFNMCEEHFEK